MIGHVVGITVVGASCRRWNVDGSILPEGGSGETKSPQHTVGLMVLPFYLWYSLTPVASHTLEI